MEDEKATEQGSILADSTLLGELMLYLRTKGILTTQDIREIHEGALLKLETLQGHLPEHSQVLAAARRKIERPLKG